MAGHPLSVYLTKPTDDAFPFPIQLHGMVLRHERHLFNYMLFLRMVRGSNLFWLLALVGLSRGDGSSEATKGCHLQTQSLGDDFPTNDPPVQLRGRIPILKGLLVDVPALSAFSHCWLSNNFGVRFHHQTPILPNWTINWASPVLAVPFWTFWWATFIGMMPATFLYVKAFQGGCHALNVPCHTRAWCQCMACCFTISTHLPPVCAVGADLA